jgi:hypothetical protein
MECSLSTSAKSWSCEIFLQLNFDRDGKPLSSPQRHTFAPQITDKGDVEIWLRRAQMAVLSPHCHHEDFTKMSREQLKEFEQKDIHILKFSKNTVSVRILDPDSTDLSFIDLPGLNFL